MSVAHRSKLRKIGHTSVQLKLPATWRIMHPYIIASYWTLHKSWDKLSLFKKAHTAYLSQKLKKIKDLPIQQSSTCENKETSQIPGTLAQVQTQGNHLESLENLKGSQRL